MKKWIETKKIVLLAHCILNVNSKIDGLALYAGADKEKYKKNISIMVSE